MINPGNNARYRNDIQALRGMAVLAVVLFHAKEIYFPLGYLGVDAFFVISGFVVTPLIIRAVNDEDSVGLRAALANFYKRRFFRLAPALGATLGISAVFVFLIGNFNDHLKFAKQGLATISLLGNFGAYMYSGDYFSPNPNPLIHTWSLSVEEQIYLFLPIAILVLFRTHLVNRHNVLRPYIWITFFSAIAFVSPGIFNPIYKALHLQNYNQVNFYSPFSRIWEFTLGGIIYFLAINRANLVNNRKIFLNAFLLLPLFAILFSQLHVELRLSSILASLITGAAIYFRSLNALPKFVFERLKWLGDRSYSIYLIHMPIIYFANHSTFTELQSDSRKNVLNLIAIFFTLFLGSISYRKIEQRYRSGNLQDGILVTNQLPYVLRIVSLYVIVPTLLFGAMILGSNNNYWGLMRNQAPPFAIVELEKRCPSIHVVPVECQSQITNSRGKLLLVGDSHALVFYRTISRLAKEESLSLYVWWQNPTSEDLSAWIIKNKPVGMIASSHFHLNDNLTEYVKTLGDARQGTNVLLVGQVPQWTDETLFMNESSVLVSAFYRPAKSTTLDKLDQERIAAGQKIKQLAIASRINFLDPMEYFCTSNSCTRWEETSGWLYFDGNHLSDFGGDVMTKGFRDFILKSDLSGNK